MIMKYTKGPWHITPYKHQITDTFGVKDIQGAWVAKCHPFNGTINDIEESEANARLIAAAPDLLEACKEMLEDLMDLHAEPNVDDGHHRYQYAIDAIDKAEGESC